MYVSDQKHNYIISIAEAVRQLKESKSSGGFVVFVGAGISADAPSNCPTAFKLIEKIVESAIQVYPPLRKLSSFLANLKKPEDFYQVLFSNLETHFFALLDILFLGHPNSNHEAIVRLCAESMIPVVITTNFDVFIEDAFEDFADKNIKIKVHRYCAPRRLSKNLQQNRTLRKSAIPLIKIHGSLDERASIIITLRQARLRLPSKITSFLNDIFTSFPVLFVGYSGNDDDIFPVLMDIAPTAKMVFWALWDEKALNPFIQQFAENCPNCRLVEANNKNILPMLIENMNLFLSETKISSSSSENPVMHFLSKWASRIPFEVWVNFFAEITLLLDQTKETANIAINALSNVTNKHKNMYHAAKTHKNIGTALFIIGRKSRAVEEFLKAIHCFRRMKRNRETIECIVQAIQSVDGGMRFLDEDLAFLASKLSDREYNFYELGLANLASGISFLREGKIELARARLNVVIAYSLRSGDKGALHSALSYLGELHQNTSNKELANQCIELANKVRQTIGSVHKHIVDHSNNLILDACEEYYKKERKSIVVANLVWFFIIPSIISAILAHFLTPYAWLFAVSAAGTRIQILIKKYKKTRIYRV